MEQQYLRIADFIIEIRFEKSFYSFVRNKFLKNFLNQYINFIEKTTPQQKADAIIKIQDSNKSKLMTRTISGTTEHFLYFFSQKGNTVTTYYYISFTQLNKILRTIVQKLLTKNDGLSLHSSASLINGKALLFLGPSGAGKSTAAQLSESQFRILADDSLYVRRISNSYYLYQTPDFEKKLIHKTSDRYEIHGICFLYKSPSVQLKIISNANFIFSKFLKQCNLYDQQSLKQEMKIVKYFSKELTFFRLYFPKKSRPLTDMLSSFFVKYS